MNRNRVVKHHGNGKAAPDQFSVGGWLRRFKAAGGAWVAVGDRLHLLRPVGDQRTAPLLDELCAQPDAVPALRNAICSGEVLA